MATKTRDERIDALDALDATNELSHRLIAKAMKDKSPSLRTNAVQLAEKHQILSLRPNVELLLHDKSWMVRAQAAVCIGELLELTGKPHKLLRSLLRDENWVVRIDAMESLERIEDVAAIPLIAKLLRDENGIVRSYCATILAREDGDRYRPIIEKLLKHEYDPHARVGFLAALIHLGSNQLLPELLGFLKSDIYQIRCAVIHNLEDVYLKPGDRSTVISTLEKLRRKEPTRDVRSTVTSALKLLRT
jgi:HEAT repeat protein